MYSKYPAKAPATLDRSAILRLHYVEQQQIETINKTVHLIGVARNEEELARVVDIASRVPGVKKVVSHVLTKNDERRVTG